MATATQDVTVNGARKLGVVRLAVTGGLASVTFYVLCWIGALTLTGPGSHMYIELFTKAEISSTAALIEGVLWSTAFGFIAGALIAGFYNLLAFLDRS